MDVMTLLDLEAIVRACEEFGVARLRLFGSAGTDRFDPERSDVDFMVDFIPGRGDRFGDYFGLREALTAIVGRDVDLVVADSIRNPYFESQALSTARDIYAA